MQWACVDWDLVSYNVKDGSALSIAIVVAKSPGVLYATYRCSAIGCLRICNFAAHRRERGDTIGKR